MTDVPVMGDPLLAGLGGKCNEFQLKTFLWCWDDQRGGMEGPLTASDLVTYSQVVRAQFSSTTNILALDPSNQRWCQEYRGQYFSQNHMETDTELKHFNRSLIHNELELLNATLLRVSNFLCLLFIFKPHILTRFCDVSLFFISIQLYIRLWTPTVFSTFSVEKHH